MTTDTEKFPPSPSLLHLHSEAIRLLRHISATSLSASKTVALALLPSFIFGFAPHAAPDRKRARIAHLDGLRGAAAWLVFVRHYTIAYQAQADLGYGQVFENEAYTGFMRLPFLRLLYAGPLVQIFFLVSGYVLALKPLMLIRERAWESLFHSMTVSVFGRGMRLFLPPLVSTFAVMLAVRMGWYGFAYREYMPGIVPEHPERLPTFGAQVGNWMLFVVGELMNPWKWNTTASKYDSHLWTIPIQFKSAMILFLAILGLARAHPRVRVSIVVLLISYYMVAKRWDVAVHFGGFLLADLDLNREDSTSFSTETVTAPLSPPPKPKNPISTIFWSAIFLLGLYLGSFPRHAIGASASDGFGFLASLSTWHKHWHTLAAILIAWSLSHAPILQSPFTSAPMLYLGKISFSLYIVHGPVLHMFGYAMAPFMWQFTGKETNFRFQLGFGLGLLVLSPLVVWVADTFWRMVQIPCAEFARWVEKKALMSDRIFGYGILGAG